MATILFKTVKMSRKKGDVEFTTIDGETLDPIPTVSVTLDAITQLTDGSGKTTFTGVKRGEYTWAANHDDYESETGLLTVG